MGTSKKGRAGKDVQLFSISHLGSARLRKSQVMVFPTHRCVPCLPRDPVAPNQQCEATGKKDATLWRLTSPGTPAILVSVGCAGGGSPLIEGGLGHGERLQTAPRCSLRCSWRFHGACASYSCQRANQNGTQCLRGHVGAQAATATTKANESSREQHFVGDFEER